ncbi:mitochondrial fission ELM1 family protein [Desulfopila inferna]|uniref:mitochondrial fission ELM1 family protein n=1 Tax=Desulfopila inferna TaxID=468528 RepID=UPI0019639185|nr:ELM1/GtrOC1 family putative glycosyltransferase [Desulfopila inferna]MBM9602668.1 mitochondrial fission ELM1 family protein [Desulfopila inferna]
MSENNKFRLAAFLDGRPGHEKQTFGIIEELKRKIDVEVISVPIRKKNVFLQAAEWLNFLFPPNYQPADSDDSLKDCDLLLGTGTHTHLPMLLLKKHFGIPVVTCMTPSSFLQKKFDLIFSPQHDNTTEKHNIFTTIGPPNPNINRGDHRNDRVLLLCGGLDRKSHDWNTDEIIAGIKALISHDPLKRYILSSSPRTPAEAIQKMSLLAQHLQNVEFHEYQETPPGWVEEEYRRCRQVWVTGDSISMVYEALSSGCNVGILPVQWRNKNSKFRKSEEYLKDAGFVIGLQAYLLGDGSWKNAEPLNEARRCAEEIIRRFL